MFSPDSVGQVIEGLFPFIPAEYIALIAVIVAFLIILFLLLNGFFQFIKHIKDIFTKNPTDVISGKEDRSPQILKDVWLTDAYDRQNKVKHTPIKGPIIISVINMKGGVGKTTLCANIGATLARRGKRVLFIDYDYQGTLSDMICGASGLSREDIGARSYETLVSTNYPSIIPAFDLKSPLDKCAAFGASYELFKYEMIEYAKWFSTIIDVDIRIQLRDFLRSQNISAMFDYVLIDCGPRFTTSTINALCASTHFLVPTILDNASMRAVRYLDIELTAHKEALFPKLKLIGIAPTFTYRDSPDRFGNILTKEEQRRSALVRNRFVDFAPPDTSLLIEARVPHDQAFSKNAHRIASLIDHKAESAFNRVTDTIVSRIAE